MSEERILFLKKLKKEKRIIFLSKISIFLFLSFLWEVLARLNMIETFITSSPTFIIRELGKLISSKQLFYHLWVTSYETLLSFALGSFLGIFIASILWFYPILRKILDPYLTILNSLPKVAFGPLFIVWCGANIKTIILMALFISTIIMVMHVLDSFLKVEQDKITLFKSFKATKMQIYFKLILPSSMKSIISALKVCISMSFVGLLPPVGENLFLINIVVDIYFIIFNYNFVN